MGVNNLDEAKKSYKILEDLFLQAEMNLREWKSNISEFNDEISPEDQMAKEEKLKI